MDKSKDKTNLQGLVGPQISSGCKCKTGVTAMQSAGGGCAKWLQVIGVVRGKPEWTIDAIGRSGKSLGGRL